MAVTASLEPSFHLSSPPAGAINVRRAKPVVGPGGRWIPCVTEIAKGLYLAGLYQVGPGCRQVCAAGLPQRSSAEALSLAKSLAETAAA